MKTIKTPVETIPPGSFCVNVPEVKRVLSEETLLGPYRFALKFTGLDCSGASSFKTSSQQKIVVYIRESFAILIIFISLFRCYSFFILHSPSMSFPWAESNLFAYMGIHSIECAYCLYSWTKKGFVANHLEKLEVLRRLRVKENLEMDCYTKYHLKTFIWSGLWVSGLMTHSIASCMEEKIILSGPTEIIPLYLAMPVLTLMSCTASTLCLSYYSIVSTSIIREIRYFNLELEEARNSNKLQNLETIQKFCHRQSELIALVRNGNKYLGSYTCTTPLACFSACVYAVYLFNGFDNYLYPIPNYILRFNLFAVLFITFFTLRPAAQIQFHIADTSRILMSSEESGVSRDSEVVTTYHFMLGISLNHNARLRVFGGIPIYSTTVNIAMFFIPNIGNLLAFGRHVLVAYNVENDHH